MCLFLKTQCIGKKIQDICVKIINKENIRLPSPPQQNVKSMAVTSEIITCNWYTYSTWQTISPNYHPQTRPTHPIPVQSLNMSAHWRKTKENTLSIDHKFSLRTSWGSDIHSLTHHRDKETPVVVYIQEVQGGKCKRTWFKWLHSEYLV